MAVEEKEKLQLQLPPQLQPQPPHRRLPRFYAPPDPSLAAVDLPALVDAFAAAIAESHGGTVTPAEAAEAAAGYRSAVAAAEALLALEGATAVRNLRRALRPFDPRNASGAAAAGLGGEGAEGADGAEGRALDALVALLLDARYSPLTAEQWRAARKSYFTVRLRLARGLEEARRAGMRCERECVCVYV